MTKVNCDKVKCKHNNPEGICTKEEISLDYVYRGEDPQCTSFEKAGE